MDCRIMVIGAVRVTKIPFFLVTARLQWVQRSAITHLCDNIWSPSGQGKSSFSVLTYPAYW